MDAETGRIVAATLTDRDEDDASQVGPLLDQVADPVASVTADGAYDQESVYADVAERHPGADVVVPPRVDRRAQRHRRQTAPTQRDRHLQLIAEKGRMGWQNDLGLQRARPGRGHRGPVQARDRRRATLAHGRRRETEVNVGVHALNCMLEFGRPKYVRTARPGRGRGRVRPRPRPVQQSDSVGNSMAADRLIYGFAEKASSCHCH